MSCASWSSGTTADILSIGEIAWTVDCPARRRVDTRPPSRYNADMTVQTSRELLAQRPFQPSRLVMSSGQTHDVRHPEMALLTRTSIFVGTEIENDGVPAEFKICSLLHVTAIEPLNPSAAGLRPAGTS